jgi:hypothetical protein
LHEAAHIGRYDDYALIFQRILEALFAFHPVVAWIARRIDLEREMACDDVVVQVTGNPLPYASCLTHVAELAGGVSLSGLASSAAAAESHLEKRVEILLDRTRNRVTRLLRLRLAGTVAVLALMACMASRGPALIVLAAPLAPLLEEQRQAPPLASSSEPFRSVRSLVEAPESVAAARGESSRRLVQQPQESNRTTLASPAPLVWLPVVVTEPQHRYVTGLGREHFKVFEDHAEQKIAEFVPRTSELSVAVVEDIRNANGELQMAREAEEEFLRNSSPKDQFWLKSGQASGQAALLERVKLGLAELGSASNRRKVVLIISDGDDRSSPDTADQVTMLAGSSDVSIYAISLTQQSPAGVIPPVAPSDAGILDMLVEQSGGRHFMVADQHDTSEVAKKISFELRNGYLLGYQPKNTLRDGTYRQILVQLQPPKGIPQLTWMNRPGYFSSKQGR